ncbi:MAG: hypothetical protein KJ939_03535 [Nanoarchaeota archaeon]|nr:hypothetical protein [Nanoarchaeota archaeon]MCG2720220.1 hypothetical protein [Nanoarchaeota archaeon]
MQYKDQLEQHLKNKALKFYAELPEEARKSTMAEAKGRVEPVNAYLKFTIQVDKLVLGGLLDFNADTSLEEIVELLKK